MMRWRGSAAEEGEAAATAATPLETGTAAATADEPDVTTSSSDPLQPEQSSSSSQQHQQQQSSQDEWPGNSKETNIQDDDGADHAEDPPTPWKPQNEHSTCEFTHTILDYAQKRESGCKKAEYSNTTVDEFGNRWRLIVYVNGNGRASNHHLSLFLQVADADDLPFGWKKAVSYVLTLEHPKGTSLSYAKRNPDKTFKLCPKAIDWGWSQFITSDRIQQEGYVSKDTLTVRASVTVKSSSVSIDEEDSELYLKCAVEEGDVEAVKLCLEHGASVNCKFKDDLYTPLHTACSSSTATSTDGSMEVLNLLLQEGADGNACNKWKETPLLIAANNGHRVAVEALLKHGANPSLCSEAGWSALTFAAHKGYDDIVALLLRAGAPVNCPVTEDSSTPLHKACAGSKSGHLAAVKLLLNGGADVHALNKWRETPLLTAANHGQSGAVDALLQNGADPCKCTDTGWSPLSIAAYKGHDEVVRLLLEEGAPTEEDDPTLSALLQAATKGLSGTVELLLRHGADHTVTTKKGDTALSILVEQNLIDAAVEMVTGYNASIPRCSRDRKKVQRARLLINLRMKQLEREGRNAGEGSTDEEETDEEQDSSKQAQHCQDDMTEFSAAAPVSKSAKKRKKKKSNRVSAEEKARAAEEALLLELEQEESKAEKHKANANSKRKKKKERKAKEREQKLKEENARREQQEQENRERVRIRKEKEDQERKERELQLRHAREQQEREKKKKMEQEVFLAAEHKEREKERQKREQRVKLTAEQAVDDSTSNGFHGKVDKASTSTRQRPTSIRSGKGNGASPSPKIAQPVTTGNRRWETTKKTKSPSRAVALLTHTNPLEHTPASNTTLKSVLTPRSVWKSEQPHFSPPPPGDTNPSANKADPIVTSLEDTSTCSPLASEEVEHPAIALFRRDKVAELLARCSQALAMPDDTMLKRIFYRWSVRATHDSSPTLDSVIPSWTDTHRVVAFFQRQLIAESRRTSSLSASMEALKETGSLIAMYCQSIAAEVDNFRCRIEKHLPKDWTDSALGMTATNGPMGRNGAMVTVSWANRAQVFISAETFGALRERHVGAPSRFLAACFMAKLWYDTRRLILGGTTMDFRLSPRSKQCLSVVAGVSAELWSDPFNSENGNVFWGTSESVDSLFGGQKPFGKDQLGGEEVLAKHGGSLSVLLPMDANVASSYVQRMTDILKKTQRTNVPVTFFVVAHADCFHDLPTGLSLDDLRRLDPRLADGCQGFVSCSQLLQGGNHTFGQGDEMGVEVICNTTSLFVVLQNDAGRTDVDTSQSTIANIIGSLSFQSQVEDPMVTSLGISNDSNGTPLATHGSYFESLPPISPDPHRIVRAEIGAIGGAPLSHPFSPSSDSVSRVSRNRGRLFDLVDNGEEDDVDLVSGMLNNLDVGLFQNNNVGSDVDIEAISLMGIGGPPHSVKSGRSHQGGFS